MEMIFTKTTNSSEPEIPDNSWTVDTLGDGWSINQQMVLDHGERVFRCSRETPSESWSSPVLVAEWGVTFPLTDDEAALR